MSHNAALGKYGEDLATSHLRSQGMAILARNWRCDIGEIDIVARDGDVLVVCEVKTRSRTDYGTPFDAISAAKADRLLRLACVLGARQPDAIRRDSDRRCGNRWHWPTSRAATHQGSGRVSLATAHTVTLNRSQRNSC